MKIIASANRCTFLVEAHEDELAKCAGYPYTTSMPDSKRPAVGVEIDVTSAYENASNLISTNGQLEDAVEKMQRAIKTVEKLKEVLAPAGKAVKSQMPSRS